MHMQFPVNWSVMSGISCHWIDLMPFPQTWQFIFCKPPVPHLSLVLLLLTDCVVYSSTTSASSGLVPYLSCQQHSSLNRDYIFFFCSYTLSQNCAFHITAICVCWTVVCHSWENMSTELSVHREPLKECIQTSDNSSILVSDWKLQIHLYIALLKQMDCVWYCFVFELFLYLHTARKWANLGNSPLTIFLPGHKTARLKVV